MFFAKRYKWFVLTLSIVMMMIGILIFVDLKTMSVVIITLAGVGLIVFGIGNISAHLVYRNIDFQAVNFFQNLLNILFGALLISYRYFAAVAISIIVAIWLLFSSINKIWLSVKLGIKNSSFNWKIHVASGLIGQILCVCIFLSPEFSSAIVSLPVAVACIFLGILFFSEFIILNYMS